MDNINEKMKNNSSTSWNWISFSMWCLKETSMKEIQWQLPLGRYQSMLNPLAVVFKKWVFLLQEWNFAHFNKYFRIQRCSDEYSNINLFYSKGPSSSRKSARWMLSKTSNHTLYSVVVTSKIMSTLVLKNNPILIDSLLWKERKKEQRPFCLFSILSVLVHFIIWHIKLSRNVLGANGSWR